MTAFAALAQAVGILPDYVDFDGVSRPTTPETQIALLAAMGIAAETEARASEALHSLAERNDPDWRVVEACGAVPEDLVGDHEWQIAIEDGTEVSGRGAGDVPPLPLGRHALTVGARTTWLLAAPPRLPDPARAWGVTASLAGLRTPSEGGMGSYADLGRAATALGLEGAAFLGINPVHAGFPGDETAFSPYSPSHRGWLNTALIHTGQAPAERGDHVAFEAEIAAQRMALKRHVETLDPHTLQAYLDQEGAALTQFATHQALSDLHGPYWDTWPNDLKTSTKAVAPPEAVQYHAALQYLAGAQLSEAATQAQEAGMGFGLYLDLAVGSHPYGAETWENPGLYAQGAFLGAPPDHFTPAGQNWTLAPFVPRALAAEGFASFAAILRRQFRYAKLLRIDHILGFERAFWALDDPGLAGAYVQMPRDALLAVTRIEAARAGATVVGEDLGNIPGGLREALAASGLLGYRLMMFEHGVRDGRGFTAPEAYPSQTLASFSTHDLPTWRGWRGSRDIDVHHRLGHLDASGREAAVAQRRAEVAALDAALDSQDMHTYLARCASTLVAVQAENVFDVDNQLNLPGTVHEYPNWRGRLPVSIDAYGQDTRLKTVAALMRDAGR